ncbi:GNAT family N-acetyltransferase [Halorubrum gandharaense]
MELRRLPPDEDVLRRFARECWLPYHRDLAAASASHALADWDDDRIVEANVDFYRGQFEEDGRRGWLAVVPAGDADGGEEGDEDVADPATAALTDPDIELVAHLLTEADEAPAVFDRPDRLVVGDIYVREPYRGTGLADRLVERAAADAREHGCGELRLDVDAGNERALAFYAKQGFETYRKQLTRDVDGV